MNNALAGVTCRTRAIGICLRYIYEIEIDQQKYAAQDEDGEFFDACQIKIEAAQEIVRRLKEKL